MNALATRAPTSSGVNGPEPAELALGLARDADDEIDPSHEAGADDLGDLGIGPAGGDQLLQHAHVARGDVVIEIVARPVPLLAKA